MQLLLYSKQDRRVAVKDQFLCFRRVCRQTTVYQKANRDNVYRFPVSDDSSTLSLRIEIAGHIENV